MLGWRSGAWCASVAVPRRQTRNRNQAGGPYGIGILRGVPLLQLPFVRSALMLRGTALEVRVGVEGLS